MLLSLSDAFVPSFLFFLSMIVPWVVSRVWTHFLVYVCTFVLISNNPFALYPLDKREKCLLVLKSTAGAEQSYIQ